MVGQTRLQDSAWLAQLAKHASEAASASRSLLAVENWPAVADPINVKISAKLNRGFIRNLRSLLPVERLCNPRTIMRSAGVHFPHRFQPY